MSTVHTVPIDQLVESPTNPRKSFAGLDELAASIREHGVLTPILVRLNGDPDKPRTSNAARFELVAGARRFRAGKLAGLKDIPAIIRKMTDEEVLDLQLVENIQREDMHPMDEAEALDTLIKRKDVATSRDPAGVLAARLGKGQAYVLRRLMLLKLPAAARKAFRDGRFGIEGAMAIARLSDEAARKKAAEEIEAMVHEGSLSVDYIRDMTERLTRDLSEAPFDVKDADLLPQAGSCSACPKRTGNLPGLFNDLGKTDACTDGACFKKKCDADWARRTAKAKASGQKILTAAECKEVFKYGNNVGHAGYVRPKDGFYDAAKGKNTTYSAAVGKEKPATILARDPRTGEAVELWTRTEVEAAHRRANPKVRKAKDEAEKKAQAERQRERERMALDRATEEELNKLVAARVRDQAGTLTTHQLAQCVAVMATSSDYVRNAALKRAGLKNLAALLSSETNTIMSVILSVVTDDYETTHELAAIGHVASILGIDPKKARNDVAARLIVEAGEKKKAAKKGGAK
jgi:ParB/RepB/Spo0J family partition protein